MRVSTLYLLLTARCNLRCRYCYQNAKTDARLQWDAVRAGIDLLCENSLFPGTIMFSGGEPMLEFGLVRRAVEYGESLDPEKNFGYYATGEYNFGKLFFVGRYDFMHHEELGAFHRSIMGAGYAFHDRAEVRCEYQVTNQTLPSSVILQLVVGF